MDLFGSIDLTLLGQIVREHPEAVKVIQKKDGTQHKYINININERRQPDQNGRTHYAKVGIPKANQKQHLNYFVADLKPSQSSTPAATVSVGQAASPTDTAPVPNTSPSGTTAEPELPF